MRQLDRARVVSEFQHIRPGLQKLEIIAHAGSLKKAIEQASPFLPRRLPPVAIPLPERTGARFLGRGTQRHQAVRYLSVLIPLVSSHLFPRPVGGTRAMAPSMLHWGLGALRDAGGSRPSTTRGGVGIAGPGADAPLERHDRRDEARGRLRSPNVAASRTLPRPTTWRSSSLALGLAVSTATGSAGASEPCSGAGASVDGDGL